MANSDLDVALLNSSSANLTLNLPYIQGARLNF